MTIEYFRELTQQPGKQLFKFGADWCMPCKALDPILTDIANDISVVKIDIEDSPELAQSLNIRSIPYCIAYIDGVQTGEKIGLLTKTEILRLFLPK